MGTPADQPAGLDTPLGAGPRADQAFAGLQQTTVKRFSFGWISTNVICWFVYFAVAHFNLGRVPWPVWVTFFTSSFVLYVFPAWLAGWLGTNLSCWFIWWALLTFSIGVPWPLWITLFTSLGLMSVRNRRHS